ncbi:hypothetical protein [Rhizobium laguerreae]|uniref:hypothetical protein n=1 Tax=Rhizobium laguerreae TaxID=1076926 RepID=UPI001C9077BF|nr:hypothetical protein [Rhizobium laguerreae]MBY3249925.1 hypothetical protein [Rhizobium laguerreae]
MHVRSELTRAVERVWTIPADRSTDVGKTPEFIELEEVCSSLYGEGKCTYALDNALRSLGVPCALGAGRQHLVVAPTAAAEALHDAFVRKTVNRRYLCPLDLADDLPSFDFGPNKAGKFTSAELAVLLDADRLHRHFPAYELPLKDYAQFRWLVVEEEVAITASPNGRAIPFLTVNVSTDFGEIDPHVGRFPKAVEAALFFLLLAPWEDWVQYQEVNWRAFQLPWIHTVDDDLFSWPKTPQNSTTLSLQPDIVFDARGTEIDLGEKPSVLPLNDGFETMLAEYDEKAWAAVVHARATALFETPIIHFLVRAFVADGMDEIMAHMTTIEAGLGLVSDHKKALRRNRNHQNVPPRDRVAARLGALLLDPHCIAHYQQLFELRSAFVHGRGGLSLISTAQRLLARNLARRVAQNLVTAAQGFSGAREDKLEQLLDAGVGFLKPHSAR